MESIEWVPMPLVQIDNNVLIFMLVGLSIEDQQDLYELLMPQLEDLGQL